MNPSNPPASRDLGAVIEQLRATGWPVIVCDHEWRLRWVSHGLLDLLDLAATDELGYGENLVEALLKPSWQAHVSPSSTSANLPTFVEQYMLDESSLQQAGAPTLEAAPDAAPPSYRPTWSGTIEYHRDGLPSAPINLLGLRLHDRHGQRLGVAIVFGTALATRVHDLLARGDEQMFDRMARRLQPRQEPTGILFADLEGSTALSRRLPSAQYFHLLRELTTAWDSVVIEGRGLVSKHAGDGIVALFPQEEHNGVDETLSATIVAARRMQAKTETIAREVLGRGDPGCVLNAAVHWSGSLHLGQIVTGGRLEVTALGDEMNECSRLEQVARGGELLVSQPALEHLRLTTVHRLVGDSVVFETVAARPGISEKARRDVGHLGVIDLRARPPHQ